MSLAAGTTVAGLFFYLVLPASAGSADNSNAGPIRPIRPIRLITYEL